MADSRYEFTDNQGRRFDIHAADWNEAYEIAQRTIREIETEHRQASYQRAEDLKARVDSRTQDEIRDWRDFSAHKEPRYTLPHVPFEERENSGHMGIDAAAAMMGNGSGEQMQPRQVGKQWTDAEYAEYRRKVAAGFDPYANLRSAAKPRQQDSGGWGCAIAVMCVILAALFVWMLSVT